jgi:hypothetical protein
MTANIDDPVAPDGTTGTNTSWTRQRLSISRRPRSEVYARRALPL